MLRLTFQLLPLLAAIGCGKAPAPAPAMAAPAPAAAPATPPRNSPTPIGTVRGKVFLTGWTPRPTTSQMIDCCGRKIPVVKEDVQVGLDGSLDNVIIYLKNAPPTPATATLAPAVLDQVKCTYVPHVLALRTGQTLTIKSGDNTLHNVHSFNQVNPAMNFGMNRVGARNLVLNLPETFRVKCDVHPWMSAWVAVFDHPWFDVSSSGGTFAISSLPPGPQTIVAWHERFGELEQEVTITRDQTREITFTFKPPNAAQ
jgi:hypothetical protein